MFCSTKKVDLCLSKRMTHFVWQRACVVSVPEHFMCVKKCLHCNIVHVKQCVCACAYHFATDVYASSIHPVCAGICSKKFLAHVTTFTYKCSRKSHVVMLVQGLSCDPQPWNGQLECQERISTKTTWKWTDIHLPWNVIILEYNRFHDNLAPWIRHFYTD